ncbi:Fic family protein [Metallibacterium scheffleri]|uniref:Fic family protein n=1 Tax=Metallibacterium scheffleri TaxID=993689 RepID=UPI0023F252E9|nr:RNA-binding domain-containing protein [Metallibacterium scheffleri]
MNEQPLTEATLLARIDLGEHTRQQFKRNFHNPDALAAELAAFANSGGGTLLIGVADDGIITGLSAADVRQLNQMLSNASSQHLRPPVHPHTENVQTHAGLVMVVTVPNGLAKPYLDQQGRIWVKQGADKRHVTAREELQRMFQRGGLVYADLVPVPGTTSAELDEPAFRRYLAQHYSADTAPAGLPLDTLLQNLGLGDGLELNLTGLLLFGRNPLRWRPAYTIKAVAFPGTRITDTRYLDSQDISGTLPTQYAEALAFIKRNLHRVQGDQGFNSPGILEVPEIALQELLVNALVHRDYFTSASIRILVFTDRIDIISPGHLPDSLSIDDIRHGKSNRRNPTLSEHAFRLLPYRGLGSGIPRALDEWPQIELIDEVSGNQFTARVQRPKAQWAGAGEQATEQVTEQVAEQVAEQVRRLCLALGQEAKGTKELMQSLNLKHRPSFLEGYLNPALQQRFVELTQPDSPRSPTQKYRLTAQGKALLK